MTAIRKKQLTTEGTKVLEKNLIDRMSAAHKHMTKLLQENNVKTPNDLKGKPFESYKHLYKRFEELQISYRLVHNTNWLQDMRTQELQRINFLLADESKLHTGQAHNYKQMKAAFESQLECPKCNQTGIAGENISTGEFKLCTCVTKHLQIYRHL